MNFKTTISKIRISAKKVRVLTASVKKESPIVAMERLSMSPLKASKILAKAIKNTLHNASASLKVPQSDLRFVAIQIDEGAFYKRMRPGPKGMANFYKKRTSHITIEYNIPLETKSKDTLVKTNENVNDLPKAEVVEKVKKINNKIKQ